MENVEEVTEEVVEEEVEEVVEVVVEEYEPMKYNQTLESVMSYITTNFDGCKLRVSLLNTFELNF